MARTRHWRLGVAMLCWLGFAVPSMARGDAVDPPDLSPWVGAWVLDPDPSGLAPACKGSGRGNLRFPDR